MGRWNRRECGQKVPMGFLNLWPKIHCFMHTRERLVMLAKEFQGRLKHHWHQEDKSGTRLKWTPDPRNLELVTREHWRNKNHLAIGRALVMIALDQVRFCWSKSVPQTSCNKNGEDCLKHWHNKAAIKCSPFLVPSPLQCLMLDPPPLKIQVPTSCYWLLFHRGCSIFANDKKRIGARKRGCWQVPSSVARFKTVFDIGHEGRKVNT